MSSLLHSALSHRKNCFSRTITILCILLCLKNGEVVQISTNYWAIFQWNYAFQHSYPHVQQRCPLATLNEDKIRYVSRVSVFPFVSVFMCETHTDKHLDWQTDRQRHRELLTTWTRFTRSQVNIDDKFITRCLLQYAIWLSLLKASYCIVCVTASTSMFRLQGMTL